MAAFIPCKDPVTVSVGIPSDGLVSSEQAVTPSAKLVSAKSFIYFVFLGI